jgi:hypothetical protein
MTAPCKSSFQRLGAVTKSLRQATRFGFPKAVRDLHDLTPRRLQLIQDATRERNRVEKLLEHVNVKIGNVLSGPRFLRPEDAMQQRRFGGHLLRTEAAHRPGCQLDPTIARPRLFPVVPASKGKTTRALRLINAGGVRCRGCGSVRTMSGSNSGE